MTNYKPDIYGETPPQALWPVFHFIAKRWALSADEKGCALGEEVEPVGSPPPGEAGRTHIELIKDCYLLFTATQESVGDKDGSVWIRKPMSVFNNLSPLDMMTRTPEFLRRHAKPTNPAMVVYWNQIDPQSPTVGLELVRGLFTFNKPDVGHPKGARHRLHELISVATYKPR